MSDGQWFELGDFAVELRRRIVASVAELRDLEARVVTAEPEDVDSLHASLADLHERLAGTISQFLEFSPLEPGKRLQAICHDSVIYVPNVGDDGRPWVDRVPLDHVADFDSDNPFKSLKQFRASLN